MVFMQDYVSMHTSDDVLYKMAWLGLEPISCHAKSPNLHLIETIWFKSKLSIKVYAYCPTWIEPLWIPLKAEC